MNVSLLPLIRETSNGRRCPVEKLPNEMASLKSMDILQIQNLTQESLVAQELLTFTNIIEVTL